MYAVKNQDSIAIYNSDNQIIHSIAGDNNRVVISPDNKYLATYEIEYDKKTTLEIKNIPNFEIIVSLPEFNGFGISFSDEPKLYFRELDGKFYSWDFLQPNSTPILFCEFSGYDSTIHFIQALIYRNRKFYLLYTYLTGENYKDACLEIVTINIDTLKAESIDFGRPLPSFYHYGSYEGPRDRDRTIMTTDYKFIVMTEPYLISIDLKTKTWKETRFHEFELMDISNNHFLIFKNDKLQLLEYDSMKVIKDFPYPGLESSNDMGAYFLSHNSCINKFIDKYYPEGKAYLRNGSSEKITDRYDIKAYFLSHNYCLNKFIHNYLPEEKAYSLNLQNGSSEKITDRYDDYYTNYQSRHLYLFDQITKLIIPIRVLQEVARYYQIAFDMVYEIIRQLLFNYQIENRELTNYLNIYTRSIGATKEKFQTRISNLLLVSN